MTFVVGHGGREMNRFWWSDRLKTGRSGSRHALSGAPVSSGCVCFEAQGLEYESAAPSGDRWSAARLRGGVSTEIGKQGFVSSGTGSPRNRHDLPFHPHRLFGCPPILQGPPVGGGLLFAEKCLNRRMVWVGSRSAKSYRKYQRKRVRCALRRQRS